MSFIKNKKNIVLFNNISTEWLRKLESLFFILPKDIAVSTKNLKIKNIYLMKWQHPIQYFVQLSLFLAIVNYVK
jgi:hypothetical protein